MQHLYFKRPQPKIWYIQANVEGVAVALPAAVAMTVAAAVAAAVEGSVAVAVAVSRVMGLKSKVMVAMQQKLETLIFLYGERMEMFIVELEVEEWVVMVIMEMFLVDLEVEIMTVVVNLESKEGKDVVVVVQIL